MGLPHTDGLKPFPPEEWPNLKATCSASLVRAISLGQADSKI